MTCLIPLPVCIPPGIPPLALHGFLDRALTAQQVGQSPRVGAYVLEERLVPGISELHVFGDKPTASAPGWKGRVQPPFRGLRSAAYSLRCKRVRTDERSR